MSDESLERFIGLVSAFRTSKAAIDAMNAMRLKVLLLVLTSAFAYTRRGRGKGLIRPSQALFSSDGATTGIDDQSDQHYDELIEHITQSLLKGRLTVTESLDNGESEYQDDIQGQTTIGHLTHPTGNTVETLWNPIALGTGRPNPFPGNSTPYFPGPNRVVGLNKGWCISMIQEKYHCEEWLCQVHATFYRDTESILRCFPPGPTCNAVQKKKEIGAIQFSGIWPACSFDPEEDFEFQLVINGGTGPFRGVKGWVNVTQFVDYHFTYRFHFE